MARKASCLLLLQMCMAHAAYGAWVTLKAALKKSTVFTRTTQCSVWLGCLGGTSAMHTRSISMFATLACPVFQSNPLLVMYDPGYLETNKNNRSEKESQKTPWGCHPCFSLSNTAVLAGVMNTEGTREMIAAEMHDSQKELKYPASAFVSGYNHRNKSCLQDYDSSIIHYVPRYRTLILTQNTSPFESDKV
jgi:hypothetical protein